MTEIRLRHMVEVNPPSPIFDKLPDDAEVTFLPMESVWPGSRLDLSRTQPKRAVSTGYTRFQSGDVLVPKITPTFEAGRAVLVPPIPGGVGVGTTELHVLRPSGSIDPRFLLYAVNARHFLKLGEAEMYGVAGQKRVPDSYLRDFIVDLPTLQDQGRIADFLDAETARIDRLVAAMRQQLALFDQFRRATSSIAWCGHDQNLARLGYFVALVTSGPRGWGDYVGPGGEIFFRSANLRRDNLDPNLNDIAFVEPPSNSGGEAGRSRIKIGDVLVGITGANTGWISVANEKVAGGYVSQHVCLVRPAPAVYGKWLAYLLSSNAVQDLLMSSQYGGTKTQLSLPDIRNLRIPVCGIDEQRHAVAMIDKRIGVVDEQHRRRLAQLRLLAEKRQALITAAVTGQFDVTTARSGVVA